MIEPIGWTLWVNIWISKYLHIRFWLCNASTRYFLVVAPSWPCWSNKDGKVPTSTSRHEAPGGTLMMDPGKMDHARCALKFPLLISTRTGSVLSGEKRTSCRVGGKENRRPCTCTAATRGRRARDSWISAMEELGKSWQGVHRYSRTLKSYMYYMPILDIYKNVSFNLDLIYKWCTEGHDRNKFANASWAQRRSLRTL